MVVCGAPSIQSTEGGYYLRVRVMTLASTCVLCIAC